MVGLKGNKWNSPLIRTPLVTQIYPAYRTWTSKAMIGHKECYVISVCFTISRYSACYPFYWATLLVSLIHQCLMVLPSYWVTNDLQPLHFGFCQNSPLVLGYFLDILSTLSSAFGWNALSRKRYQWHHILLLLYKSAVSISILFLKKFASPSCHCNCVDENNILTIPPASSAFLKLPWLIHHSSWCRWRFFIKRQWKKTQILNTIDVYPMLP